MPLVRNVACEKRAAWFSLGQWRERVREKQETFPLQEVPEVDPSTAS